MTTLRYKIGMISIVLLILQLTQLQTTATPADEFRTNLIFKPETILVYTFVGRWTGGAEFRYLGGGASVSLIDYVFLLGSLKNGEKIALLVGVKKGLSSDTEPLGYEFFEPVDGRRIWNPNCNYVLFDEVKCDSVSDILRTGRITWYEIKNVSYILKVGNIEQTVWTDVFILRNQMHSLKCCLMTME